MAGVSYDVEIDDKEIRRNIHRLKQRVSNMLPFFNQVGSMLVSSTIYRFEKGIAPSGAPWTPSKKPEGKTLIDKAHLRDSITFRADGDSVSVGTSVIYGRIHQLGGQAGRGHKVTITERPYLGVSDSDERGILDVLKDHLQEAFA